MYIQKVLNPQRLTFLLFLRSSSIKKQCNKICNNKLSKVSYISISLEAIKVLVLLRT